jgi:hypothetical protein
MIETILAIANAIPIVDGWLQLLVKEYFKQRIESMRKENRDAIIKIGKEYDQRDLEKAIGSPTAGEASQDPGAIIRDPIHSGLPK